MFEPEVLEETETSVKMRINDAVVITLDEENFDKHGDIQIDYDEKLITANEAEEIAKRFMNETLEFIQNRN